MDSSTKVEKEKLLNIKIEEIKKKNEELMLKHEKIKEDMRLAEIKGQTINPVVTHDKKVSFKQANKINQMPKEHVSNFLYDKSRDEVTSPSTHNASEHGMKMKRHPRNFGGFNFEDVPRMIKEEKVKQMNCYSRKMNQVNNVDDTLVMTGKERLEMMEWRKEKDAIDKMRLMRQKKEDGGWKREWDQNKELLIQDEDEHDFSKSYELSYRINFRNKKPTDFNRNYRNFSQHSHNHPPILKTTQIDNDSNNNSNNINSKSSVNNYKVSNKKNNRNNRNKNNNKINYCNYSDNNNSNSEIFDSDNHSNRERVDNNHYIENEKFHNIYNYNNYHNYNQQQIHYNKIYHQIRRNNVENTSFIGNNSMYQGSPAYSSKKYHRFKKNPNYHYRMYKQYKQQLECDDQKQNKHIPTSPMDPVSSIVLPDMICNNNNKYVGKQQQHLKQKLRSFNQQGHQKQSLISDELIDEQKEVIHNKNKEILENNNNNSLNINANKSYNDIVDVNNNNNSSIGPVNKNFPAAKKTVRFVDSFQQIEDSNCNKSFQNMHKDSYDVHRDINLDSRKHSNKYFIKKNQFNGTGRMNVGSGRFGNFPRGRFNHNTGYYKNKQLDQQHSGKTLVDNPMNLKVNRAIKKVFLDETKCNINGNISISKTRDANLLPSQDIHTTNLVLNGKHGDGNKVVKSLSESEVIGVKKHVSDNIFCNQDINDKEEITESIGDGDNSEYDEEDEQWEDIDEEVCLELHHGMMSYDSGGGGGGSVSIYNINNQNYGEYAVHDCSNESFDQFIINNTLVLELNEIVPKKRSVLESVVSQNALDWDDDTDSLSHISDVPQSTSEDVNHDTLCLNVSQLQVVDNTSSLNHNIKTSDTTSVTENSDPDVKVDGHIVQRNQQNSGNVEDEVKNVLIDGNHCKDIEDDGTDVKDVNLVNVEKDEVIGDRLKVCVESANDDATSYVVANEVVVDETEDGRKDEVYETNNVIQSSIIIEEIKSEALNFTKDEDADISNDNNHDDVSESHGDNTTLQ